MKYYMQLSKLATDPFSSTELAEYSKRGWDLVTVKPDWTKQNGSQVGMSPIPAFETWIFSKESENN